MNFKEALGIDVSKKTIDVHLHLKNVKKVFDNSDKGFKLMINWVEKQSGIQIKEIAICFEHTGLYSLSLAVYLDKNKIIYSMVPALEIKNSLGITRGKSDEVDALRISEYAYLRRDTLQAYQLPSEAILKLQKLVSLRAKLVTQRAGYKGALKENKEMLKQTENKLFFKIQKKMITYFSKEIDSIEQEIKILIKSDDEINRLYDLITSVKGIGFVLASHFLIITNCFTCFENSRQFACYAGIAPFERQSGTSLNKAARVSHFANKKMKALLNVGAWSAIQNDPEIRNYYKKRVQSGKSKMSTVNIVRNKLVHRVFAVVKRGTPYVALNSYAA